MANHAAGGRRPGAGGPPGGPSFGERRLAEETRERFLREIVGRVPLERLVAVHVFPPIRQGGQESGVAVIAAEPPPTEDAAPELVADAPPEPAEAPTPEAEPAAAAAPGDAVADAEAEPAGGAEPVLDPIAEPGADPTDDAAAAPRGDVPERRAPEHDLPREAVPEDPEPAHRRPQRHTVFVARYRLTIKGPDRGRWEADVVEEADAPLVTVEAVVRGVQRRAGDDAEPEHLDAATIARLVGAAWPAPTPAPTPAPSPAPPSPAAPPEGDASR